MRLRRRVGAKGSSKWGKILTPLNFKLYTYDLTLQAKKWEVHVKHFCAQHSRSSDEV